MKKSWQNWCRLCAKINWSDEDGGRQMELTSDLLEIINKCLSISPEPYEGSLLICSDCSSFLEKLKNFRNLCLNADKMFQELKQEASETEDLFLMRLKYGFEKVEIKEEPSNENTVFDDIQSVLEIEEPVVVKLETPNEEPEQTEKKRGRPRKAAVSLNLKAQQGIKDKLIKREISIANERTDPDKEAVAENDSVEDDGEALIKREKPMKKSRSTKKIKESKKEYTCAVCSKKYRYKGGLKRHIWSRHCKEERPFECSNCQKRFTTKANLRVHLRIHLPDEETLIHPCQYCDKKFAWKGSAKAHMNTMHNPIRRTFTCEECGKSLKSKCSLKYHTSTHTTLRNLKCPSCPKMFKNKHQLSYHKASHKGTGHPCPHCDAKYDTKSSLRSHLLLHSDVKYKCSYCEKEFRRPWDFKHHIFVHTGDKPYKCRFCKTSFRTLSVVMRHEQKIHQEKYAAWKASGLPRKETTLPKLEYLLQSKSESLE